MALERNRSRANGQLLAEATLIGEQARATLREHGYGFDVENQIGDMVAGAVDRALKLLRGAMPAPARSFEAGGTYKFVGPVDNSPPAESNNVAVGAGPADPAADVDKEPKHEPEPERSGPGEVRWML